jgi:Leucine-rich repeat (LRR) protein
MKSVDFRKEDFMDIAQAHQFIDTTFKLDHNQYLKRNGSDFQATTSIDEALKPEEINALALECLACITAEPTASRQQTLGEFRQALVKYSEVHDKVQAVSFANIFEALDKADKTIQSEQQLKEGGAKTKEEEGLVKPDFSHEVAAIVTSYAANLTPQSIEELEGLLSFISRNKIEEMQAWSALASSIGIPKESIQEVLKIPSEDAQIKSFVSLVHHEIARNLLAVCHRISSQYDYLEKELGKELFEMIKGLPPLEQAKHMDAWIRTNSVVQNIKGVNLAKMGLSHIPLALFELRHLESVDVSKNKLITLPAQINQWKALQHLDLENNQLTELPPQIGELQALQSLDVNENGLLKLTPQIGQLKVLRILHVSNNKLGELPSEIGQLESLVSLLVSENELRGLPSQLGQLKALRVLDVRWNPLQAIPPLELPALETIYISSDTLKAEEIPAGLRDKVKDLI